jgi:hypothetical protein
LLKVRGLRLRLCMADFGHFAASRPRTVSDYKTLSVDRPVSDVAMMYRFPICKNFALNIACRAKQRR